MSFTLHTNSVEVTERQLELISTPDETKTWRPIPHSALLSEARHALNSNGFEIQKESFILSLGRDGRMGERFFGVLNIADPTNADYQLSIGIRNAHDKQFAAGFCVGTNVLVCSNLAFSGEVVIARKHTLKITSELPELISTAVQKVDQYKRLQDTRAEKYKKVTMEDKDFSHLAIAAMQKGVIGCTQIPEIIKVWEAPTYEEFEIKSAWSAFNVYTQVLKGVDIQRVSDKTISLYGLMDQFCERKIA